MNWLDFDVKLSNVKVITSPGMVGNHFWKDAFLNKHLSGKGIVYTGRWCAVEDYLVLPVWMHYWTSHVFLAVLIGTVLHSV